MKLKTLISTLALATLLAAGAHADPLQDAARAAASSKIHDALATPVVIDAIKAQNTAHAAFTQADVDRLDGQWRKETKGGGPLTSKVLGNALSTYLKKVQADSAGLYTELFVMDNKGLNVGQSGMTSDYWQGDEAKWKKTYLAGPDAVFVDEVQFDESSQMFQVQVSVSITDPANGKVIGAATVAIDADKLEQ